MGGIRIIDALVIQTRGDDIKCTFGGPSKDPKTKGKFVAWIELYNGGEYHRSILNTDACFDSGREAKAWAEKFVEAVRKMNLMTPDGIIPSEDLKLVQEIISALRS
ncbi:MAG: hypothetical protein WCT16_04705 [Candidatus Buchananbacteria bacterium]